MHSSYIHGSLIQEYQEYLLISKKYGGGGGGDKHLEEAEIFQNSSTLPFLKKINYKLLNYKWAKLWL